VVTAGSPLETTSVPPTFSVVIPTYERPTLLRAAIGSVLRQDCGDFECIVVDDGGSVELNLPVDPRLRLIRHPRNLGLPSALNTGLDAAVGEFVTFLDDDDELTADRLSSVLAALGRADVVLCWADADAPPPPANRILEGRVYDTILDTLAPPKGAVVIARDRVPRFDARYLALEDLEWWLRVADTLELTTVPHVGYRIHRHPGRSATNGPVARVQFGEMLLRERVDYFGAHRRATALRWRTIGGIAYQLGEAARARRALVSSLRAYPTLRAFRTLVKAMRPSRTSLLDPEPGASSASRSASPP
jgi:glycosyltransferase involved in cell wall biosynthesis